MVFVVLHIKMNLYFSHLTHHQGSPGRFPLKKAFGWKVSGKLMVMLENEGFFESFLNWNIGMVLGLAQTFLTRSESNHYQYSDHNIYYV